MIALESPSVENRSGVAVLGCKQVEVWNLAETWAPYGFKLNSPPEFFILFVLKNIGRAKLCTQERTRKLYKIIHERTL